MVRFFIKITKMPDLGFGTSYSGGLCPKLEKNPAKPKLSPQNVLYDTSCPLLNNSRVLEFVILAKISTKIAFHITRAGGVISMLYQWKYAIIFLKFMQDQKVLFVHWIMNRALTTNCLDLPKNIDFIFSKLWDGFTEYWWIFWNLWALNSWLTYVCLKLILKQTM